VRWAAVLAALLLAGCGSGTHAARGGLADDEIDWIRAFVHWETGFLRRSSAVASGIQTGASPDLTPVLQCAPSFRRAVGAPPTRRLRRPQRLLLRSCADYLEAARLHERFRAGELELGIRASGALSHADESVLRAFNAITALLWEGRRLPRIDEASSDSRVQTRYTTIARRLTSRDVETRCWDDDGWRHVLRESAAIEDVASVDVDGYAVFATGRMNLSPDVCDALDDLVYRGDRPRDGEDLDRLAYGVLVLAHESEHLAGVDDEALATCNGMQHMEQVARLLGVEAAYARTLTEDYWRNVYEHEPDDYRTPSCAPNGTLDLSPGDGTWP